MLSVVDAHASNVADTAQIRSLGSIGLKWTSPPQWSPESDGLWCPVRPLEPARARDLCAVIGPAAAVTRFPNAPIFLQWTPQHTIVFVRHDRYGRRLSIKQGCCQTRSRSEMPRRYMLRHHATALCSSSQTEDCGCARPTARNRDRLADLLHAAHRRTDADPERSDHRWNRRTDDGSRDILIERGRIARIAPAGSLSTGGARCLTLEDASHPRLMDLHAHTYRPDLLPVSSISGSPLCAIKGFHRSPGRVTDISAGVLQAPVGYGGFQFYSDWPFDEEQGRGIEPEADPGHIGRAVALAEAFGAQHIKTRTFRRWDINARMITEAHRRGMRATGHCAHLLPLVAAGMDAKEHTGTAKRGATPICMMTDPAVPGRRDRGCTHIEYLDFAVRLNGRPALLDEDAELAPFLPSRENFKWMLNMNAANREQWAADAQHAREAAAKLWRAGVTIGTGTDIWQIQSGVHMELEQMVRAGLTPAQGFLLRDRWRCPHTRRG